MQLPQHQRHDAGQDGRKGGEAHRAHQPFPDPVLPVDVGLQILRAGDVPGLGVAHPVFVDEQPVDQVQDGQYGEQLPESRPEPPGAVDGIDADQHEGEVEGNAQALEDLTVLPDPLPGDEAVLHASVLHVPMVQEHHGHGSLSDAHGAEEGQQRPQQNAFYDDCDDHASSPHSISVPALAVAN